MATYDVHVGDGRLVRDFRAHLAAASPSEAIQAARRSIPEPAWHGLVTVYRHRRLRRPALVGTYAADGPGDDGPAGVREPRRPHPAPPSLSREAEPGSWRGRWEQAVVGTPVPLVGGTLHP